MPAESASRDSAGAAPAGFRRVALASLLGGLCPLIPVPFVDDWALGVVRRRAVGDLLRARGLDPTPTQVRLLAGGEPAPGRGCLVSACLAAGLRLAGYLAAKVFRKVVYVLAVRDAVRAASDLFADAYLLDRAASSGAAAAALAAGDDGARRLRAAVEATAEGVDATPLRRAVHLALTGSAGALLRGARLLRRALARGRRRGRPEAAVPVEEEAGLLDGVLDRLATGLWLEEGYRRRLEERFDAHWMEARTAVQAAAAGYDGGRPEDSIDVSIPSEPGSG